VPDPVTAPTPDDLARHYADRSYSFQDAPIDARDAEFKAFLAGYAAAVAWAVEMCDREAVAAGARCTELERVGRANGWPDNVRADYSTWCLMRDSAKAHADRIRKLVG
jgi:hypothetical protein